MGRRTLRIYALIGSSLDDVCWNLGAPGAFACGRFIMSHSKITEVFMDMFKSVIELKGLKANEHFQNLLACLKEHNLLYTVANIHPKFFLTHSANRGGLLLSPHNVHRNAARIRKCGADTKQLTNALAIELAASGTVREQHVDQNDMLIKRAGGCSPALMDASVLSRWDVGTRLPSASSLVSRVVHARWSCGAPTLTPSTSRNCAKTKSTKP